MNDPEGERALRRSIEDARRQRAENFKSTVWTIVIVIAVIVLVICALAGARPWN